MFLATNVETWAASEFSIFKKKPAGSPGSAVLTLVPVSGLDHKSAIINRCWFLKYEVNRNTKENVLYKCCSMYKNGSYDISKNIYHFLSSLFFGNVTFALSLEIVVDARLDTCITLCYVLVSCLRMYLAQPAFVMAHFYLVYQTYHFFRLEIGIFRISFSL